MGMSGGGDGAAAGGAAAMIIGETLANLFVDDKYTLGETNDKLGCSMTGLDPTLESNNDRFWIYSPKSSIRLAYLAMRFCKRSVRASAVGSGLFDDLPLVGIHPNVATHPIDQRARFQTFKLDR